MMLFISGYVAGLGVVLVVNLLVLSNKVNKETKKA